MHEKIMIEHVVVLLLIVANLVFADDVLHSSCYPIQVVVMLVFMMMVFNFCVIYLLSRCKHAR